MSDAPPTTPPASSSVPAEGSPAPAQRHFIQQIIDADIESGKWAHPGDRAAVRTRFPPEPNGYLHVGHAKSICLNFGLAKEFGGLCNLRFDDTNPAKEDQEYVDSIIRDVRWLGFKWPGAEDKPTLGDHDPAGVRFASDYFEDMYTWARELIEKGLAYVDEQPAEAIRAQRGSLREPGTLSPHRDRPAAESLDLFERMKAGEFENGSKVLRAKIDMASPNMNLRDPVMYRIVNARHHRTGDTWHIYPMYDWAHGIEDSIEGITHSICTLEFEDHRPLYDWFIDAINKGRPEPREIHHPQQIEFARLNPTYIVTSKRKLKQLVDDKHVSGWDDPRMPTLSGLRRRGYTPEAVKNFVTGVGVTKFNAAHDLGLLEEALRDDLNQRAQRRMAVLDPIRVTITNWVEHGDADRVEIMPAVNNPNDERAGSRDVVFSGSLLIERDDFMIDPPKKFFRLGPGREVRLRYGYWVTCHDHATDTDGNVTELFCTYDPGTRGGNNPPPDADGKVRKVKGTIHWVSGDHAIDAEVRLFDRLFAVERPDRAPKDVPESWSFLDNLNPESLRVVTGAKLEPALAEDVRDFAGRRVFHSDVGALGPVYQFERLGYFCLDRDTQVGAGDCDKVVFNRAVTLRDSWAKAKQ